MPSGRNLALLAIAVALQCVMASARADSVRCGTALIQEGARTVEIRETCGEPVTIETTSEPVYSRRVDGTVYQIGVEMVEYWYYDFGPRRFPVRMTVKGGVAEKIELLSRNR
jgi:Protein of unknown function (DUF2845)